MSEFKEPHVINNEMNNLKNIDTAKFGSDLKEQVYTKETLTPEEAVNKYLSDPKTKINAIYWADQLNKRFNGNWFSIDQVVKKTQFKQRKDALDTLQLLCLMGVCMVDGGKGKYKITLDLDQRILLLTKEKERLNAEKERMLAEVALQYDVKIAALGTEIERMSSIEA